MNIAYNNIYKNQKNKMFINRLEWHNIIQLYEHFTLTSKHRKSNINEKNCMHGKNKNKNIYVL